jgi:predicted dehydrogenase
MTDKKANIALIGAGWWSQGWHLPCLDRSKDVNLVAIVDTSSHPKSNLNPDLESLETLKQKYHTKIFSDTKELLNEMGPELDGVLIATPHATHYAIGKVFMEEIDRRKEQGETKPLHILMEKPMSTDVQDSLLLYKLVKDHAGPSQFWINHSANFRTQAKMARDVISSGKIGKVRHITGFFASPLMWIFDDPTNKVSFNLGHLFFLTFFKPTNILRGLERAFW